MHLLPTNLAALADLASRNEGKYAMTGVHLRVHGDNTYRAAGTDGKRLLVVSGPCPMDPKDWPTDGPIRTAPNGEMESIVPAGDWRKTFKTADRAAGKAKAGVRPVVATVVGKAVTSFATAGPKESTFDQHPNTDGRFPPYMDVIPAAGRSIASIPVDAGLLADLLVAVENFTDDEYKRVTLELHGRGEQGHIVVRSERSDGQAAVGLVVSLGKVETSNNPPVASDDATEDRLREKVADLEADVVAWRKAVAERDARIGKLSSKRAGQPAPEPPFADGAEVAALRRQVAVLQAINARLIREQGMVGA